ncbi:Bulb-type lectin domain containing protein [Trema orientale]|uniref:Bulb-type lectin domain containing protein n=1 Tax=Trema orientale TaxID=63057 RepID=A0A2P5AVW8_TREOI|nr:Bulb-type lectin domain containing protein [Trema orientale]
MGKELRKWPWFTKPYGLLFVFSLFIFLLCSPHLFCYATRDTIQYGTGIMDSYNTKDTPVSDGKGFELGFFTWPAGSPRGGRYDLIWYNHNLTPPTVVWLANRTSPLVSIGIFIVAKDGNLQLLDDSRKIYWSNQLKASSSYFNRIVQLMDSGNLELREENDELRVTLW